MIRCTIEILPGGREAQARIIGCVEITNIATRLDGTADYAVALKKTPPFKGALRDAWKKGMLASENDRSLTRAVEGEDDEGLVALVSGHHRTRRGVYDLLFRALRVCGLETRNPRSRDTEREGE